MVQAHVCPGDYLWSQAGSFVGFRTALRHDGTVLLSIVKELGGIEIRMSSGDCMQVAEEGKRKRVGNHFPQHITLQK